MHPVDTRLLGTRPRPAVADSSTHCHLESQLGQWTLRKRSITSWSELTTLCLRLFWLKNFKPNSTEVSPSLSLSPSPKELSVIYLELNKGDLPAAFLTITFCSNLRTAASGQGILSSSLPNQHPVDMQHGNPQKVPSSLNCQKDLQQDPAIRQLFITCPGFPSSQNKFTYNITMVSELWSSSFDK